MMTFCWMEAMSGNFFEDVGIKGVLLKRQNSNGQRFRQSNGASMKKSIKSSK